MNRIDQTFSRLRDREEKGLVTFLTAGDPDVQTSAQLFQGLAEGGADIIEFGMPFSDPMADGPAIQAASLRALGAGANMNTTLAIVRQFREKYQDQAAILMGYANPIFQYGVERFCQDAAQAGVDGLIIVDLPPEEVDLIQDHARTHNLHLIYLVTPTTDEARLAKILKSASGFLYYVSITGITGAAAASDEVVTQRLNWIRSQTDLPVVVGFGIKTPQDAAKMAVASDAVVVGSALVDAVSSGSDGLETCKRMVNDLKQALKK